VQCPSCLTHSLTYSLQSIDCIVLRIALHVLMYVYVCVCVYRYMFEHSTLREVAASLLPVLQPALTTSLTHSHSACQLDVSTVFVKPDGRPLMKHVRPHTSSITSHITCLTHPSLSCSGVVGWCMCVCRCVGVYVCC
jgi:hypothetical protein